MASAIGIRHESRGRPFATRGSRRRYASGPDGNSALVRRRVRRAGVDRRRIARARRRRCAARTPRCARARLRPAAGGRGRRSHARPRAARAAGHADRDPPEDAARRLRLRAAPERRAASALARAARDALSARDARRDGGTRRALHVLARRIALRVSGGDRARRRNARVASAQADGGRIGEAVRFGRGDAARRAHDDRARAHADRRARLRALLPHRPRRRCIRALARHPVPGPRLGGELGRLLRARHHRSRSRALFDAVRALHLEGAQRAARHRRRLRAPAARGSDAIRLRQVWP